MSTKCNCGSNKERYPVNDGYGFFLTYVCDFCYDKKMAMYVPNIHEHYEHSEDLE